MNQAQVPGNAKQYQAIKIKLFFLELVITILYLLIFQLSGFSHATAFYFSALFKSQILVIAGYLCIFGAIYYLITFPLQLYKGLLLEKRYSLSNQTFLSWLKDNAKETVISSVVFLVLVELFYFLLNAAEKSWWLWMALVWFLFSVFFARVFPTLILPLFYKYKQIDNIGLKQALLDLAKTNNVSVLDVFQIDFSKKTKKANAALAGVGKSKRIILTDTLLANYTDREIKVVLAHELGHYKHRHMWKLILFGAISNLIAFYLIFISSTHIIGFLNISKIANVEAFPAISLILTIFGFLSMGISNTYSRNLEKEADTFALTQAKDSEAFISCMDKLGKQNLADFSPNRFIEFLLYNHPPISKRIKFAKENFK